MIADSPRVAKATGRQTRFRPQWWPVASSLESWDLTLPVERQQLRGHDQHSGKPNTSSQALCDLVGNTKYLPGAGTHHFPRVLLRRLRQALFLSVRNCRCGRPLDTGGHHRAACARAGVLGRRGFALERVAASREARGRVRTNILPIADGRKLEVVVDGLLLQGRAQLAVDTTLVCALHPHGRPRLDAARHDGVALKVGRPAQKPLSTQNLLALSQLA